MKRLLPFATLLAAGTLQADVKPASVFTDNLVLQRGKPVAVWGTADPGEEVTVTFAGQSKNTRATKAGEWKLSLDKLEASPEPRELKLKGKNEVTLKNILVGEVWVCSGQSNMQWTVRVALNPDEEIKNAAHPQIRLFQVPRMVGETPQSGIPNTKGWQVCSPETVADFSAVAYYFGRELNSKLKVPIGLIDTSWGGTRAEAWTSKPALEAVPTCREIIKGWDQFLQKYDALKAREQHEAASKAQLEKIAKIKEENAKPGAQAKPVPRAPGGFDDLSRSQHRPAVLFNAMIAPLVPYTARGAIWYQGESNQRRAVQYATLLPTMIKDWRKQWGDTLSFYIVQLAGFGPSGPKPLGADDTWAELQWAQFTTAGLTPRCGLAVANDIGEEKDIHPKNKQEVGRRLALQALVNDYKVKGLVPEGPVFVGATVKDGKVVVRFNHAGGLKSRDGGELKGFLICGEDKVWKTATARVMEGRPQVEVSSAEVKAPVAVRYAWTGWIPEANLVNGDGLPAGLFRTDKFDLMTKGNENPFTENVPPAAAAPGKAPAPATTPGKQEEIRKAKPAAPAKKAA